MESKQFMGCCVSYTLKKKKKSQSSWARAGVATIHCPLGSRNLLSPYVPLSS